MATKIRNLIHRDENGKEEVFFPKTSVKAIFDTDGKRLDAWLDIVFMNIYAHAIVTISGVLASATVEMATSTVSEGDIYFISSKNKFAFRPKGSVRLFSDWTSYPQPFYFYSNGDYFSDPFKKIYLDIVNKKIYCFDGSTFNEL